MFWLGLIFRLRRSKNNNSSLGIWTKVESKRQLWEDIRSMFRFFNVDSMESLYLAILSDIKVQLPDLSTR